MNESVLGSSYGTKQFPQSELGGTSCVYGVSQSLFRVELHLLRRTTGCPLCILTGRSLPGRTRSGPQGFPGAAAAAPTSMMINGGWGNVVDHTGCLPRRLERVAKGLVVDDKLSLPGNGRRPYNGIRGRAGGGGRALSGRGSWGAWIGGVTACERTPGLAASDGLSQFTDSVDIVDAIWWLWVLLLDV